MMNMNISGHGDLPADVQVAAAFASLKKISKDIDKYLFLRKLHSDEPREYYRLLLAHTAEILPFIYTPTVGEACIHYHELPIETHGLYIAACDRGGGILSKLRAWPQQHISVVVVTDGERILGLGDLGANGMGISEGKATLYTAAAGVDPCYVLPVCIDVGTSRQALRQHPRYRGLRHERLRGDEYDALLDEFVAALSSWRPHVVLQFEDFGNVNAFRLLDRHASRLCCFNDDIQGTAATCLAVVLAALRGSGRHLADQRVLFLGAGEAGIGIANLMALCMLRQSTAAGSRTQAQHAGSRTIASLLEARQQCFFMDSQGLVCASRKNLQHHKLLFAHAVPFQPDLHSAIRALRPSVLVGVSTIGGAFDEAAVRLMCDYNEHPVILPLSNPTANAEVTFEQAYRWSAGRVIFASGSPFPPLTTADGRVLVPAQANNAYIFPAVGHAAMLTQCAAITDDVFLVAAETLGAMASNHDIQQGRLFPAFEDIKAVSARIMGTVGRYIVDAGLGIRPQGVRQDHSWEAFAAEHMWGGPPRRLLPLAGADFTPIISRL